jgi:hypothetical protein
VQEVQKALGGPSRKSRRRGARLKPGASAELANLFSQQQVRCWPTALHRIWITGLT